ncbi:MAG: imidazole glycerol phosphate synthase subunit HisF [Flavobacteriales bacterium]
MLTRRIIPCLDIKDGRTVKGVHFEDLRDAGDPVELAIKYNREGADELVFLDITATTDKRKTLTALVERIASNISIPFTVGGGITSVEDVDILLHHGADKVSINSAAVKNPALIAELASRFGSQCVVVAVDGHVVNGKWMLYTAGGRVESGKELFSWCHEAEKLGAGEILFTSMDNDGTKKGFAIDPLAQLSSELNIPVIASGGAGSVKHFAELFTKTQTEGALAASIFHFGDVSIPELKKYLSTFSLPVRI